MSLNKRRYSYVDRIYQEALAPLLALNAALVIFCEHNYEGGYGGVVGDVVDKVVQTLTGNKTQEKAQTQIQTPANTSLLKQRLELAERFDQSSNTPISSEKNIMGSDHSITQPTVQTMSLKKEMSQGFNIKKELSAAQHRSDVQKETVEKQATLKTELSQSVAQQEVGTESLKTKISLSQKSTLIEKGSLSKQNHFLGEHNTQATQKSSDHTHSSSQKSITRYYTSEGKMIDPEIQAIVLEMAHKYELDPIDLFAQIEKESNFNPKAVSEAGAKGLMQFMPISWKAYGRGNIFDPRRNIEAGARYMKDLLKQFRGDREKALAAYNLGPTKLRRYIKKYPKNWKSKLPRETRTYIARIPDMARQMRQHSSSKLLASQVRDHRSASR